jgi:hypothetical protein
VLQPFLRLREDGWDVTIVAVDQHGRVDPQAVARALRDDTALVSIMLANNEVGTLQPVAEIAALARSRGAVVHTDAAQAAGKIPVDVGALGVDLLTLAGHKFYATKGVGAMYVRAGTPLAPVLVGAEHERGLRPGTENVPAIVGLEAPGAREGARVGAVASISTRCTPCSPRACGPELNGHPVHRLPNTLNVSFRASGRACLSAEPRGRVAGRRVPRRSIAWWRPRGDGIGYAAAASVPQWPAYTDEVARQARSSGVAAVGGRSVPPPRATRLEPLTFRRAPRRARRDAPRCRLRHRLLRPPVRAARRRGRRRPRSDSPGWLAKRGTLALPDAERRSRRGFDLAIAVTCCVSSVRRRRLRDRASLAGGSRSGC